MIHKRSEVVRLASTYIGARRGDNTHKMILDVYNTYKHSGWTVKTPWCAIYFSFIAIKLGYTDIIPTSASCGEMINQCLAKGIWIEKDDYDKIKPGMGVIYAWDDGKDYAVTDNKDGHDHIGWIIDVDYTKKKFLVVEGNMGSESVVGTIIRDFNGRYIRGFIDPKYDEEVKPEPKPEPNPNNHPIYYSVKKGDTLSKIGKQFDIPWKDLAKLNGIKSPYTIYVGQTIRLK